MKLRKVLMSVLTLVLGLGIFGLTNTNVFADEVDTEEWDYVFDEDYFSDSRFLPLEDLGIFDINDFENYFSKLYFYGSSVSSNSPYVFDFIIGNYNTTLEEIYEDEGISLNFTHYLNNQGILDFQIFYEGNYLLDVPHIAFVDEPHTIKFKVNDNSFSWGFNSSESIAKKNWESNNLGLDYINYPYVKLDKTGSSLTSPQFDIDKNHIVTIEYKNNSIYGNSKILIYDQNDKLIHSFDDFVDNNQIGLIQFIINKDVKQLKILYEKDKGNLGFGKVLINENYDDVIDTGIIPPFITEQGKVHNLWLGIILGGVALVLVGAIFITPKVTKTRKRR